MTQDQLPFGEQVISDRELESWLEYHRINARLRVVNRVAHRSILSRKSAQKETP